MRQKKIDVITIGESMVLFQPSLGGQIPYAPFYTSSVGGAESNFATALTRLGVKTKWISHLGQDPFAKIILSALSGEGVDISDVKQVPNSRTAVFFKESKGYGDPNVYYYRNSSAASEMKKSDVQDNWFDEARHLHVTGITLALGEGTTDMIREVMTRAREKGMTVSFDPNIRRKLLSIEEAREKILSLIPLADIFLPGVDEAELLLGKKSNQEYLQTFNEMGAKVVVLKLGEEGSHTRYGREEVIEPPFKVSQVIDTVGAGDAFAAGFISAILDETTPMDPASLKRSVPEAARRANVLGALATQFKGDWEGNPTLEELNHILDGTQGLTR